MSDTEGTARRGISRRALLAGGASAVGAGVVACGDRPARPAPPAAAVRPAQGERFFGDRQAGITSPAQTYLHMAAFDLQRDAAAELRDLLHAWSQLSATLMDGAASDDDTHEAADLQSARLTITHGLGPGVFGSAGRNPLGLRQPAPAPLRALPGFRNDALEDERCGGDLLVQVCSDDPQVAFHAVHALTRAATGVATPRWTQTGFTGHTRGRTNRNLMGFKDGTRNVQTHDRKALSEHVFVGQEGPAWLRGGTYAVVRRIRILLDVWDATSLVRQEQAVGRHKDTGAPLGGRAEDDPVDLRATRDGAPIVASDAHVRLAAPEENGGIRMLRRGFNYADGVDAATGQLDAGLVFISFQRDPQRQFVPIQRRLAERDALAKHLQTTGSAVFACPPGAKRGGFVGEGLFA